MNSNKEFFNIVNDILENDEFNKLKDIKHHGLNRFDHSFRVSYYSYLVTKKLGLDYKKSARAGLLHDFFLDNNEKVKVNKRFETLINHPKYALENSCKYFELSDMEKDIILTHMFPVSITPPKYIESWLVDLIDDGVSIYERYFQTKKQLSFAYSFLFILFFNYFR